jgi:phytoene dehydrogenase-like protein
LLSIFNGLGLGRLVWAAKLAKTGERVLILEKNTLSGGFATTHLHERILSVKLKSVQTIIDRDLFGVT